MSARADGVEMNSQLRHAFLLLLLLTMRSIGEMVGSLGGRHLHPLSVPCVFGCSSEVNARVVRRCCPRYEFFLDLVERGSEMPDFDGHDLFCHFK